MNKWSTLHSLLCIIGEAFVYSLCPISSIFVHIFRALKAIKRHIFYPTGWNKHVTLRTMNQLYNVLYNLYNITYITYM